MREKRHRQLIVGHLGNLDIILSDMHSAVVAFGENPNTRLAIILQGANPALALACSCSRAPLSPREPLIK